MGPAAMTCLGGATFGWGAAAGAATAIEAGAICDGVFSPPGLRGLEPWQKAGTQRGAWTRGRGGRLMVGTISAPWSVVGVSWACRLSPRSALRPHSGRVAETIQLSCNCGMSESWSCAFG